MNWRRQPQVAKLITAGSPMRDCKRRKVYSGRVLRLIILAHRNYSKIVSIMRMVKPNYSAFSRKCRQSQSIRLSFRVDNRAVRQPLFKWCTDASNRGLNKKAPVPVAEIHPSARQANWLKHGTKDPNYKPAWILGFPSQGDRRYSASYRLCALSLGR